MMRVLYVLRGWQEGTSQDKVTLNSEEIKSVA